MPVLLPYFYACFLKKYRFAFVADRYFLGSYLVNKII